MVRRTTIAKRSREHFMLAADEEFARFEQQEMAIQKADREERAARLGLPLTEGEKQPPARVYEHQ